MIRSVLGDVLDELRRDAIADQLGALIAALRVRVGPGEIAHTLATGPLLGLAYADISPLYTAINELSFPACRTCLELAVLLQVPGASHVPCGVQATDHAAGPILDLRGLRGTTDPLDSDAGRARCPRRSLTSPVVLG